MTKKRLKAVAVPEYVKLDIGCGKNKKEGFIGVDQYAMPGVDIVANLVERTPLFKNSADPFKPHGGAFKPWPWKDGSVEEVHCSHFLEHLTATERVHFMNELYRVLRQGGKATVITPHWGSNRAYGDPTHQWPPVSEMFFYYLNREWRKAQAPHTDKEFNQNGYDCDFDATWGYSLHPALQSRNQEYQQHALQFFKESAQDTLATLVKK